MHRLATALGAASVALLLGLAQAAGAAPAPQAEVLHFRLAPNPKFLPCLAADAQHPPTAEVTVTKGQQNDTLQLALAGVKPGLAFSLFTMQNSGLKADGTADPAFANFGLAWYHSDVDADAYGGATATVQSVLVDQVFGFDAGAQVAPTNTFHVGIWFDDPNAAAACGFDASHPTPFNGEHHAGPNAMMSTPDATTGLGPLCGKPNTSTTPPTCTP